MKKKELKEELQNYLDTKLHAGGLYGLTIHDEGFVEGLIKIFNKFKNLIIIHVYSRLGDI